MPLLLKLFNGMIDSMKRWADVNGIYQIYPRSFKDMGTNGVGDILGIIDKLDYIKGLDSSLGIDAVWLSPFYPSPMVDCGYDITDYCDVDPLFGTLEDFRRLLDEAHRRHLRVMLDFVPNHTSNKHPWFIDSSSSRLSSKRDWYIWSNPRPDGSVPNNWLSVAGGSAWEFDVSSGQYYMHSFLKEQPDLNWTNSEVRDAMKAVIDFWLSMGVDGFRADAVRWMAKDVSLRDNPSNPDYKLGQEDPYHSQIKNSNTSEQLVVYLGELASVVEGYDDRILLFEDYPNIIGATLRERYSPNIELYKVNPRVAMPFNFEGMFTKFDASSFCEFVDTFQSLLLSDRIPDQVPVYCMGNHDQSRIVSRFGREQARLIALMQLSLPGLPVIYYGDEIGMHDVKIASKAIRDSFEKRSPGQGIGRDPERTPMQWSHDFSAGFSMHTPWLPVPDTLSKNTVFDEQSDTTSFLALYKIMLGLRHNHAVLRNGFYETSTSDKNIFSFKRYNTEESLLIVLNFSNRETDYYVDESYKAIVTSTMQTLRYGDATTITLRPFEGVILRDISKDEK